MHKRIQIFYCVIFLGIYLFSSCKGERDTKMHYSKRGVGLAEQTEKEIENNNKYEKINISIGKRELEVSLGYEVKKQKIESRKWVKCELIEDFKIGGIIDTTFSFPTQVRTDASSNIYVLDMRAKCVKKFDSKGQFRKKFGRDGKGPGEFISPAKMDVLPNGKIIVLDPNLNRSVVFDGDKVYQIPGHLQPLGICFNNDFEFSTLQVLNPFDYSPIRKYDFRGEKIKDYQNLLLIQSFGNLVIGALPFLNGELLGIRNDGLIYVPRNMNHFVKFSDDGAIEYSRNTIEDIKLPSFKREKFDVISFKFPKEQISSLSSSLNKEILYIVSYQMVKETKKGIEYVFDCYSTKEGDYIYSFTLMLDEKMTNIHMTEKNIYVLKHNTELSVFSYKIME